MDLEQAVYQYLSSDATVRALVGSRIHPGMAPAGEPPPYVVYQPPTRERRRTLNGYVNLNRWLMQIDCHAETYAQARQLWLAVSSAMESFQSGDLNVQAVLEEDTDGDVELPADGGGYGLVRLGMELAIWCGGNQ